jgi:hypothetical protein
MRSTILSRTRGMAPVGAGGKYAVRWTRFRLAVVVRGIRGRRLPFGGWMRSTILSRTGGMAPVGAGGFVQSPGWIPCLGRTGRPGCPRCAGGHQVVVYGEDCAGLGSCWWFMGICTRFRIYDPPTPPLSQGGRLVAVHVGCSAVQDEGSLNHHPREKHRVVHALSQGGQFGRCSSRLMRVSGY